jgi:hypothetical protein
LRLKMKLPFLYPSLPTVAFPSLPKRQSSRLEASQHNVYLSLCTETRLLTNLLVHARVEKHKVGRKGTIRQSSIPLRPTTTDGRRIQTMTEEGSHLPDNPPRWSSSDAITRPSQLSPLPESPESAIHPPIDLETGSEIPIVKSHWWSRSSEPRQHSPLTATAHAKSSLTLLKEILFSSWVNLLLVFVPVGIALHFVNVSPTVVFVMNFLAIIPLAGVGSLISLSDDIFFPCPKSC